MIGDVLFPLLFSSFFLFFNFSHVLQTCVTQAVGQLSNQLELILQTANVTSWTIQVHKGSFIGKTKQNNPNPNQQKPSHDLSLIHSHPFYLLFIVGLVEDLTDVLTAFVSLQAAYISALRSGVPSVSTGSRNAACCMQTSFSRSRARVMPLNAIGSQQASYWNSLPSVSNPIYLSFGI